MGDGGERRKRRREKEKLVEMMEYGEIRFQLWV
jgi:hypothetical protein